MKNKMLTLVWNVLYCIFNYLSELDSNSTTKKNRVYDNLGIIDTLGDTITTGKLTKCYFCELYSAYTICLPFSYNLTLIRQDINERYITIRKEKQ